MLSLRRSSRQRTWRRAQSSLTSTRRFPSTSMPFEPAASRLASTPATRATSRTLSSRSCTCTSSSTRRSVRRRCARVARSPRTSYLTDRNSLPHTHTQHTHTLWRSQVRSGRPSPYMVHRLMEIVGVEDVRVVAKAGDTERDIGEGLNAGCGQVFGVLSGADSFEALSNAGAHHVIDNVTSLVIGPENEDPVAARLHKLQQVKSLISPEAFAAKEREILANI